MYRVKIGTGRVLRIATLDAVLTKIWAVLDTLGKHGAIRITILEGPGLTQPRGLVRALDYGRLLFADEYTYHIPYPPPNWDRYQFAQKYILDGLDDNYKHNPNWTVCTNTSEVKHG